MLRSGSAVLSPLSLLSPCLTVAVLFLLPGLCEGQEVRTVGFHVGYLRSRQLWSGSVSTGHDSGFSFGVTVDVPTPIPPLSIRAALEYVRRGSSVWEEVVDMEPTEPLHIRSHYVSLPVQAKVGAGLGPLTGFLLAGPAMDFLLDTGCTEELCGVLREERPTVLNVVVGAGGSFDIRDRFRLEVEGRLSEGLTNAYEAPGSGIRYRGLELLARASFPF